ICAERVAILSAVTAGYKKGDFKRLYVMTDSDKLASSCFLCRQVIVEFFDKEAEVIFSNRLGEAKRYFVKELCPVPFDSEDLK
ncbi:MAG: cytidine deaminase, partial [Cetobacterium sp.]